MRRSYGRLLFIFVVAVNLLAAPLASADNLVQYTVTAAVAPTCFIIVDANNQILKILSNSNQNVTPTVYLNRLQASNKRLMTSQILNQYNAILAATNKTEGVLYIRPAAHQISGFLDGLVSIVSWPPSD